MNTHQTKPETGVDAICGLSLLLVLSFVPRGFSPGTPVFTSPQKPTFPDSNSTRNQVDEEPLGGCATSKPLFIYYFYLFIYSLFIFQGHTKITLTGNVLYFISLEAPGNYLYLEASYPRLPGDVARLRYHNTGSAFGCIEFIYHMSGKDIGWLKVYHVTDGGLETLLWGVTGDQGDEWEIVLINLLDSNYGLPSQVRI